MANPTTPTSRRASARLRKHEVENTVENTQLEGEDDFSEGPAPKRRKSSRIHQTVDYSLQRKYSNNPKGSSNKNDSGVIVKDGVTFLEDKEGLKKFHERKLSKVESLGKLAVEHSLLAQELFHLKEFTSLVTWDPEAQSTRPSYQAFVENNYDLWKNKDEGKLPKGSSRKSRHSLRGSSSSDPLRPLVEDAESQFFDEISNPSKYYYDHFLIDRQLDAPKSKKKSIKIPQLETPVKSEITSAVPSSGSRPKGRASKVKQEVTPVKVPRGRKGGRPPKNKNLKLEELDDAEDSQQTGFDDDPTDLEDLKNLIEGLSDIEVESPEPYIKDGPVPKLKLKVGIPPATVTNPNHLANPQFGSLESYLDSFKSLDEDISNEEYDEYITEQIKLKEKIKNAIANNILTIDESSTIQKVPPPPPFRDPLKNVHTHHDHLVGQAVFLSKLMADSKKNRISKARKIAQMIEVHFKRQAGAEERLKKEEERRLKALARNAIQAVKKRWILAERAYRILKNQEQEELKRIKGKEHLTQMLEHSTQLLEAQLTKKDDDHEEEEEDNDLDVIDEDEDEEEDVAEKLEEEDDSNLTVEELQAKYAHLRDLKLHEISEQDQTGDDAEDEEEEDGEVEIPSLTEKEKEAVEEANRATHDTLLDSDSSLDSDDDSDISSEEDSDDDEEGDSKPTGLAALFGNQAQEIDDDDESVVSYGDSENEGNENDDEEEEEHSERATDLESTNGQKEVSTPSSTPDYENKPKIDDQGVVDVPTPSLLLRGDLRYYQKQGLNWLASLYNNHTNGILADEMGLGKTIQTISLISYLAVYKNNWGPHLIIVPTSVLLNWEMEFKRFAPGFKLMVYYGSPQQRKEKRKGWNKPDTFHVCITSYQLVCQDQQIFKRKRWKYMILDEAHNIKNFKSNRWNALLNFNTENRLLLTGTPLQNNIMELWSLLYFLMPSSKTNQSMPSGFANLDDFQQWFGKPVDKIIEGGLNQEVDAETKKTVSKLHQVLRPYLLRRLKADVESQMPAKYEHIVYCRLSKRQYKLYHEYLARSDTKEMLKNANYISIINALMQLRKVCNHPDLFEERPITTSFVVERSVVTPYEVTKNVVLRALATKRTDTEVDLDVLNLNFGGFEKEGLTTYHSNTIQKLKSSSSLLNEVDELSKDLEKEAIPSYSNIAEFYQFSTYKQKLELLEKLKQTIYLNNLRCDKSPLYGSNLTKELSVINPVKLDVTFEQELIKPLKSRILSLNDEIDRYSFVTPAVVALNMPKLCVSNDLAVELTSNDSTIENPFHKLQTKLSIQFPDKSLLIYDCGKLQKLSKLLQELKDGGHRALIFTQMTKVLDILEQFLNIMGIRYMRLDGATKIEDRQILTERFNKDPKIMVFILSTRSGGLGINLTGADTVIFYDSDWNPAMDKQCQDRCHRIGQTRDVHIYRFVSEYTIESNILKKANQKRHLDNVIIQEGEFTTDYFSKLSVKDLLGGNGNDDELDDSKPLFGDATKIESVLAQAEDAADAQAAKEAMKEVELDNEDFVDDKTGESNQEAADDGFNDDEGIGHIDEYMIRYIANGHYYD